MRLLDCSKLAINRKNDNDVTISRHEVIVKFFWGCFVSLVKFSYWSKFHLIIITGFGVMSIYFYRGLTSKSGNRKYIRALPNIWRLGGVRDTKFGTDVSNKILLNAAKCQGYSFCKMPGLQLQGEGEGGKITLLQPRWIRHALKSCL